jgi:hypothetical protein
VRAVEWERVARVFYQIRFASRLMVTQTDEQVILCAIPSFTSLMHRFKSFKHLVRSLEPADELTAVPRSQFLLRHSDVQLAIDRGAS